MQRATQMRESRRIGGQSIFRRRIGPSLFSNLCLRPTEKYRQLARCGAARRGAVRNDAMRCGTAEAFVFWPDAHTGQYCSRSPTSIPRLFLLFSSSLFRVSLFYALSFTRAPVSFIFIASALSPAACLLCEFEKQCSFSRICNGQRKKKKKSSLGFTSIKRLPRDVTEIRCTYRTEKRKRMRTSIT